MDTDASVDQNSARKQLLNFSAACQRTPHTCVGPPSASVRSYILNKFPTNSSTSMVLASVWRKNSVSWATKCISSLKMVCKRVALSNSRRGNFEGNRTNRSTYREMDNFERSYDNCQLSGSDRSCQLPIYHWQHEPAMSPPAIYRIIALPCHSLGPNLSPVQLFPGAQPHPMEADSKNPISSASSLTQSNSESWQESLGRENDKKRNTFIPHNRQLLVRFLPRYTTL